MIEAAARQENSQERGRERLDPGFFRWFFNHFVNLEGKNSKEAKENFGRWFLNHFIKLEGKELGKQKTESLDFGFVNNGNLGGAVILGLTGSLADWGMKNLGEWLKKYGARQFTREIPRALSKGIGGFWEAGKP